jgi:hypothetical protein
MPESKDRIQSAHSESARRLGEERRLRELLRSEPIPNSLEAKYRTISEVRSRATESASPARHRALSLGALGMPRASLAAACAAVIVVGGSLTPPGRAVAQALGDLVGIGGPPTIDHAGTIDEGGHGLPVKPGSETLTGAPEGPQVVIASGTTPGGARFEVVAYRTNALDPPSPPGPQTETGEIPYAPGLAVAVDFPSADGTPRAHGSLTAAPLDHWGSAIESEYGLDFQISYLGAGAEVLVHGDAPAAASRVDVTYTDPAGERSEETPAKLFRVDRSLLERIGVDIEPFSYYLAFFSEPGDGGADAVRRLESAEARAYDAQGEEISAPRRG